MIPSTGASFQDAGLANVDNRFNARGGLASILIRDNRGPATNISPWTIDAQGKVVRNWSPFALDGKPRLDLFASVRRNGEWITNPNPNEGFWLIGATSEDGGPQRQPSIDNDDQMILQSNAPFDSDITEEGMVINFTGVETLKPLMKRIRMNLPLTDSSGNSIVEDPGTEHFSIGKVLDVDSVERQIVLIFARRKAGKVLYSAEGYSLGKLSNIGDFRRSKTDPDAGELGFTILPDPYFVIKNPADPSSEILVPALYGEWVDGEGWTGIGGAPVFPTLGPSATPGAAGAASIVASQSVGAGDPFTYGVDYKQGSSNFTAATLGPVQLNVPEAGKVTIAVTGVPAGSTVFRVRARGTNGQEAFSPTTAPVTIG